MQSRAKLIIGTVVLALASESFAPRKSAPDDEATHSQLSSPPTSSSDDLSSPSLHLNTEEVQLKPSSPHASVNRNLAESPQIQVIADEVIRAAIRELAVRDRVKCYLWRVGSWKSNDPQANPGPKFASLLEGLKPDEYDESEFVLNVLYERIRNSWKSENDERLTQLSYLLDGLNSEPDCDIWQGLLFIRAKFLGNPTERQLIVDDLRAQFLDISRKRKYETMIAMHRDGPSLLIQALAEMAARECAQLEPSWTEDGTSPTLSFLVDFARSSWSDFKSRAYAWDCLASHFKFSDVSNYVLQLRGSSVPDERMLAIRAVESFFVHGNFDSSATLTDLFPALVYLDPNNSVLFQATIGLLAKFGGEMEVNKLIEFVSNPSLKTEIRGGVLYSIATQSKLGPSFLFNLVTTFQSTDRETRASAESIIGDLAGQVSSSLAELIGKRSNVDTPEIAATRETALRLMKELAGLEEGGQPTKKWPTIEEIESGDIAAKLKCEIMIDLVQHQCLNATQLGEVACDYPNERIAQIAVQTLNNVWNSSHDNVERSETVQREVEAIIQRKTSDGVLVASPGVRQQAYAVLHQHTLDSVALARAMAEDPAPEIQMTRFLMLGYEANLDPDHPPSSTLQALWNEIHQHPEFVGLPDDAIERIREHAQRSSGARGLGILLRKAKYWK